MRRLLLLLAACGSNDDVVPDAAAPIVGDISAKVTHYDYTFDVASRAAHSKVAFTAETGGNCVTLPFRATALANATLDGQPATSSDVVNNAVKICNAMGVASGAMVVLETDQVVALQTLSTSQVGYSITKDAQQNPLDYMISWVNGCEQFGPCDSRPDQFATYTFHVTHDAAQLVRCPGAITEVSATETTCDFTYAGGPTYSTFGLAAYPKTAWPITDEGMWGDVHVTLYDRTQTTIAAQIDTAYHGGFVTWMESTFGPFPFGTELRILSAPTYWSGFEHPGNIMLDDALGHHPVGQTSQLAHTLDHEMAHQWAGDQTSLKDTYDFAWKESMAEYLAFVWEDQHGNPSIAATWKGGAMSGNYYPVPLDHPALFDYYGDVYDAGPMVLFRQLEILSSRDQVIAGLKSVLGHERALSMDELIAALQASTGLDLTQYRKDWIEGSGKPSWPRVTVSYASNALTVHRVSGAGGCKFHVALASSDGTQTQKVAVDTFHSAGDLTIPVTTTFAVATTTLDPDHECLVYDAAATAQKRSTRWLSARADVMPAHL